MPRFSIQDISQTEGQDLPEFATVKGDPQQYLDRLKSLVASHAITLDYDASIAPAKGLSQGGRITLLPNQPAAEEFSTLVHELSHERMHRTERRVETNKTVRETEAEAVAFVVCHAIRMDTNTAAVDYVVVDIMWCSTVRGPFFMGERPMATPHNCDSEGLQECEQARIITPARPLLGRRYTALCQRLRLHFQIDFRVDVGGIQRQMPKPRADGVDIDPGSQQVCGTGVAQGILVLLMICTPERFAIAITRGMA